MKIHAKRTPFGIVLLADRAFCRTDTDACTAHLVLDRYTIDPDGNVCVTAPVPIADLADCVDLLKAKLDALLLEARQLTQVRHRLIADSSAEPEDKRAARA